MRGGRGRDERPGSSRPPLSPSTGRVATGLSGTSPVPPRLLLAAVLAIACAPAAPPPEAATPVPPRAVETAQSAGAHPEAALVEDDISWYTVSSTGGQGANLRAAPSASADVIKVVREGLVVLVVGPSREAEGRRWRHVQDDAETEGWIAAEFLDVLRPAAQAAGATPPAPEIEPALMRLRVPTLGGQEGTARVAASAMRDRGVIEVAMPSGEDRVTVRYDPATTTPARIAEAIRAGGDTVILSDE